MLEPAAAERLAQVFRAIAATRMGDLPLRNPALVVETIAFRPWRGGSLGVLITPWSMNLVYLPGPGPTWEAVYSGTKVTLSFPSGDYAFLVTKEATLGTYLASSLFSPMLEFSDMSEARAVAESVMAEVLAEDSAPRPERAPGLSRPAPSRALDRRGFLRAWLPGGGRA